MAEQGRETRSRNSLTRDQPHERRSEALRQGGPFNERADSASKRRADFGPANEPVQGGRRNVIE